VEDWLAVNPFEPYEFFIDGIGSVIAVYVTPSQDGSLLTLTLRPPLETSIPFMSGLAADGLHLEKIDDTYHLRSFVFQSPQKIPCTLFLESGVQHITFSVKTISLVNHVSGTYYLLDNLDNYNFADYILVDANGSIILTTDALNQ